MFFAFDLLFHGSEDLRPPSPLEGKQALKVLLEQEGRRAATHIRYSEHFEEAGDAVPQIGVPSVARRYYLEEAGRALTSRDGPTAGPRPTAAAARRS